MHWRDPTPPIEAFRKLKKTDIDANLFQLDISNLVSGPYKLEANLFDGNKKLKASGEVFFTRLNPKADSIYLETATLGAEGSFVTALPADSLNYYMRAMAPILTSVDVDVLNMLLDKGSDKAKRFFIHRYWTNRCW